MMQPASLEQIRKRPSPAYALVMSLLMLLGFLLMLPKLIMLPAKNAAFLEKGFIQHTDTSPSKVAREQYPQLAQALSQYFSGKSSSPQVLVIKGEEQAEAFSQRELTHLHDVRELMYLARSLAFFGLFLLLLPLALAYKKGAGSTWAALCLYSRWLRYALLLGLALMLVLAAILYLDFAGSFEIMHLLAFDNDLWLLNPQQDLLIQLMPEGFFIAYAKSAFTRLLLIAAGLYLALWLLSRFVLERKAPDCIRPKKPRA